MVSVDQPRSSTRRARARQPVADRRGRGTGSRTGRGARRAVCPYGSRAMGDLSGYEKDTFTFDGKTRDVYRKGTGPGGARVRRDARHHAEGARLRRPGRRPSAAPRSCPTSSASPVPSRRSARRSRRSGRRACRRSSRRGPPARPARSIEWCKALARQEHERHGGPGVGVVGMCFTGNFALAMLPEPAVQAPVLSQPSLPLGFTKKARRGLYLSDGRPREGAGPHGGRARPLRPRPAVHRRPAGAEGPLRPPAGGARRPLRRRGDRLVEGQPPRAPRRWPTRCSPST